MDYQSVTFKFENYSEDFADLLAAFLAEIGYESFEATADGLVAYIKAEDFEEGKVSEIISSDSFDGKEITFESQFIPGRDWNEEWEKNYFKPIVVADRCVVRSSFHTDAPKAEYEIVIDPKMAFGTGHHSTTSLMLGYLLELSLQGKCVIDMGTGTGILAILALMRGASSAIGIEIDPGAYENSLDNGRLNGVDVEFRLGDAKALPESAEADIFIANINRNVITADISSYSRSLKTGGTMLLSGFYTEDIPIVEEAAREAGLTLEETRSDKNWAGLRLRKL